MSTVKENMPPVSSKKSKLPMPIMNIVSSIKKGRKRAISPTASSSHAKRSPICTRASDKSTAKSGSKRQMLGELPLEHRKIVKVRRALNSGKDNVKNVPSKAPAVSKKVNGNGKKEPGRKQTRFSCDADQSDIVFEKDDSALQSILDETGIQYGQRQTVPNFTRHTLAAVPKPQRISTVDNLPEKKVCVEDLCQVFDDFISRNARKEPPAKRHCRNTDSTTNGERFNLKLTPSKTDFCTKYGVERSTTFTGATPRSCSRQSLPGRTKSRPFDPFVLPPRSSMMSQTPRLAKVDEDPGHSSITPMRVPRHGTTNTGDEKVVGQSGTGNTGMTPIAPGRFSLTARSSTKSGPVIPAPGRVSLSEGRHGQQYTAPTPGRVSISAPRTTLQQYADETDDCRPKRLTLACTPGRVSMSGTRKNQQNIGQRHSMIDHTPGRVKRDNVDGHFSTNIAASGLQSGDIKMNLQSAFSMEDDNVDTQNKPLHGKDHQEAIDEDKPVVSKSWHDILLSESTTTMASTSATPVRGKVLQQEIRSETTGTPKRTGTLSHSITSSVITPLRVLKSGNKTDCHTPPVREFKQHPVMKTPVRVLQSKHQSHVSTPPQRVLVPASTITPKRVPVPFISGTATPKSVFTMNVEAASPILTARKTPSPPGVNRLKDGDSKKQDCVDLRTIWKTKKTPSKSPIMKEVLSEVQNEEVPSTPTMTSLDTPCAVLSSVRRKKTITWAEKVKSNTVEDVGGVARTILTDTDADKTDDDRERHEHIIAQPSCDAMQDNPEYEVSTTTPAQCSHDATVTGSTSTCDNMQLPVCVTGVTGSSVQQSDTTTCSIESGTSLKHDDPCLNVHESMLSHPSNFVQLTSDSLTTVSQQESGHHNGNVLANTMRDEYLQTQIQLFKEKERQLAQLQKHIHQHLLQGSHSGVERFEYGLKRNRELDNTAPNPTGPCEATEIASENVEFTDNEKSFKKLDNQNIGDDLVMCSSECNNGNHGNHVSQGFIASNEVNLDMNSNITVSNTVNVNVPVQPHGGDSSDKHSASSSTTEISSLPNQHSSRLAIQTNEDKGNVTPCISKTKQFVQTPDSSNDNKFLGSDRNSPYLRENLDKSRQATETNAPIWTPLAMKSVAKRQNATRFQDTPNNSPAIISDANSVCCDSKTDNYVDDKIDAKTTDDADVSPTDKAPSCRLDLGEESEDCTDVSTVNPNVPQTPPNRKSAFRSLGKSGLTPVVGSLSLRANSLKKKLDKTTSKSDALHNCVLKLANERYLEALLDDEVELFMCRLSPGMPACKGREYCYDPVSVTLTYGDEMHFIPVESCTPMIGNHINRSAFSKYTVRAT